MRRDLEMSENPRRGLAPSQAAFNRCESGPTDVRERQCAGHGVELDIGLSQDHLRDGGHELGDVRGGEVLSQGSLALPLLDEHERISSSVS